MSIFTEYEKQRELKSKLQIGSQWIWKGPVREYNKITLRLITPDAVQYYYNDTSRLESSMYIEDFMREAVYLGPVVEPAH